jgi:hypothetical protein
LLRFNLVVPLLLRFDMKLAQFLITYCVAVLGFFHLGGTVWGLEADALVVLGAAGEDEFASDFEEAAQAWERTLKSIRASVETLGRDHEARSKMLAWIKSRKDSQNREHWLILIGHGTYQQKVAKFNLLGEDVSADELQQQLKQVGGNWRIIVCASSSSPFITALSGPNRVIITATKSGSEQNYSRFGTYLARSISDVRADVDHDGGVSLLEAFVDASSRLAEWYESENRLASEQALLDDNGDQRGTPAVFFQGTRAIKAAAEGLELDGALANQCFLVIPQLPPGWNDKRQAEAVDIESEINRLRAEKTRLSEEEYYEQLEKLLIEMARLVAEPKKSDAKKR